MATAAKAKDAYLEVLGAEHKNQFRTIYAAASDRAIDVLAANGPGRIKEAVASSPKPRSRWTT